MRIAARRCSRACAPGLVQQLRQVDGPGAARLVQRDAEAEAALRGRRRQQGVSGSREGGYERRAQAGRKRSASRARTTTPTRSGGWSVWKASTRQSRISLGRCAPSVQAFSFSTAATRARLASSHESQLAGRGAKSRSCFEMTSAWRRRFCECKRECKRESRGRQRGGLPSRGEAAASRRTAARTTSSSTGQASLGSRLSA